MPEAVPEASERPGAKAGLPGGHEEAKAPMPCKDASSPGDGKAGAQKSSTRLKNKLRDPFGMRKRNTAKKKNSIGRRVSRDTYNPLGVQPSSDSLAKRVAPKLPALPPSPSAELGSTWDLQNKENPPKPEKWWTRQPKQAATDKGPPRPSLGTINPIATALPQQLEPLDSTTPSSAGAFSSLARMFGYPSPSALQSRECDKSGQEGDSGSPMAESSIFPSMMMRSQSLNALQAAALDENKDGDDSAQPDSTPSGPTSAASSPVSVKTRAYTKQAPASPQSKRLGILRLGSRRSSAGNLAAAVPDAEGASDGECKSPLSTPGSPVRALSPDKKNPMMAIPASYGSRAGIPAMLDPGACFGISRTGLRLAMEDDSDDEDGDGDEIEPQPKVERIALQTHDRIMPCAVGLHNLGNTCFINTALQCILHTPHLVPNILPSEELEELDEVLMARKERLAQEKAKTQSLATPFLGLSLGGSKHKDKSKAQSPASSWKSLSDPAAAPSTSEQAPGPEKGIQEEPESPKAAEDGTAEASKVDGSSPSVVSAGACILEDISRTPSPRTSEGEPAEPEVCSTTEATNPNTGDSAKENEEHEGSAEGEAEAAEGPAAAPVVATQKREYVQGSMAAEFRSILKALLLAETKSIDPSELIKVIGTHPFGAELCDGGQHDCQEIMRVLMDSLHEDLNRATKADRSTLPDPDEKGISEFEKADRVWQQYINFDSSPITDLYCGQFQSAVTCHKCGCKVTTYEPFLDLSLPITKEAIAKKGGFLEWFGSSMSRDLTLDDCLRAFTSDELMTGEEGYYCETCKEVTDATKRVGIHRFPNTLIIHLKRFKCTATSNEKIHNSIGFPVTDLRLHGFSTCESGIMKGDATYDLVGLVNHTGSMAGGHYTSVCKVNDGDGGSAWHNFNDVKVTKTASSNVVSHSAYILFYALRPPGEHKSKKKKHKNKITRTSSGELPSQAA